VIEGVVSDKVSAFGAPSRTRVLDVPLILCSWRKTKLQYFQSIKTDHHGLKITMAMHFSKNLAIITMDQAISKREIMSSHLPCAHQPPALGPYSTNIHISSYETQ